jgi:superfamily II DNA or RNA helicase
MVDELNPRSEIVFDPSAGIGFVKFFAPDGTLLDGACGLDGLVSGFNWGGRRARFHRKFAPVLSVIAEHGGRWQPGRGFAIREEAYPDLKRAFAAFPEELTPAGPKHEPDFEVENQPVRLVQYVELRDEEMLEREASFASPRDGRKLPTDDVIRQASHGSWVRVGTTFYRRPDLSDEELQEVPNLSEHPLRGDAVPYFFARQLAELQRDGRVVLGPRASAAKVDTNDWMPSLSVRVSDEGRLKLGLSYAAGEHVVSAGQARNAAHREYIPVAPATWVKNDKRKQADVARAMEAIPEIVSDADGYEAPAFVLPIVQERFAPIGRLELAASAQQFRRQLEDFNQIESAPLPRGLKASLRPYQKAGYDWLYFLRRYGLRGVLADDMGLGKTLQTCAVLLAEFEAGAREPALVVCPASVVNVWKAEIERWCAGVTPVVVNSRSRELASPRPRTVAIASYNAITKGSQAFQSVHWSYVVLDEAHRIKNPDTSNSRVCKALVARHRLAVTGTPIQNRLLELWSLFDFLMPGYLGSATSFGREYEVPITHQKDVEAQERLRKRIGPFKLRRLKQQVASDLPPLSQQLVPVSMVEEQRKLYDQYVRRSAPGLIEELNAGRSSAMHVLEKLLRLRQIAAHPRLVDGASPIDQTSGKFEAMKEIVESALEDEQRVLVFSQWASMASIICEYLRGKGISYSYIDGKTPVSERAELTRQFQASGGPQVMVLSLLAGGEGITLTAASVVILFDRWWNPALEDQAIARAHRIGQSTPVSAYVLETKDSVEERLADLLCRKKALSDGVVSIDEAVKRVSREELLDLLRAELEAAEAGAV